MALNILLVDDSLTARTFIAKALRVAGVNVGHIYEAGHGAEALAVLERAWVDLIFTGISMPIMDGEELVDRLAASGTIEHLPVVIVSSAASEPRIRRLKDKGVRGFIRKPVTPEQIREAVDKVMGVASHE